MKILVRFLAVVAADGVVTVLAESADGVPMKFVDGVDVAQDGTIWFTGASMRFDHHNSIYMFIEGRATGRLISYSPETGDLAVRRQLASWIYPSHK